MITTATRCADSVVLRFTDEDGTSSITLNRYELFGLAEQVLSVSIELMEPTTGIEVAR